MPSPTTFTDVTNATTFAQPAHATIPVTEPFQGTFGTPVQWPIYGQGWPRIEQR